MWWRRTEYEDNVVEVEVGECGGGGSRRRIW